MRRALLVVPLCLAGCGQNKADQAMQTEKTEIAACRTTYPANRSGMFGALVRCEMGAAANYVEVTDPSEKSRQERLANDLQAKADQVDSGRMTAQDWQLEAADAVHSLKDAKHTAEATSAVL